MRVEFLSACGWAAGVTWVGPEGLRRQRMLEVRRRSGRRAAAGGEGVPVDGKRNLCRDEAKARRWRSSGSQDREEDRGFGQAFG